MASPTKTFMQTVQTAIAAILNGATEKAFNSVHICPSSNDVVQRLTAQGTKFPACVLVDEGGEPHPHNTILENRRFSATVAVRNIRDPQGEWATEYTLDLCELLQAGDGTNPGQRKSFGTGAPIRSLAGPESAAVGAIGANEIIYRTMYFDYILQRS